MVRQALLQNQTPEIQAKLLAMQKMMTHPKADGEKIPTMPALTAAVEKVTSAATTNPQSLIGAGDAAWPRLVKPPVFLDKEEQSRLDVTYNCYIVHDLDN